MEMEAQAPTPVPTMPAAETAAAPPAAGRLFNRNYSLLWMGQSISQLGNQAYSLAMMFWLMEKTGSASLMGLVMTFSSLPALLLTPLGGTFVDRHSRIRIIVICDLLAGCALLVMTTAVFSVPGQVKLLISLLFVVATSLGLIRSFFMPAIAASIPDLVPREKLAAANSLNQFSVQAALFVGQAVGGILYKLVGAPVLFLIDALSFLFASASSSFIRLPERQRERGPAKNLAEVFHTFRSDLAEGFRYVWKFKGFRYFLAAASLLNFFMTPVVVLFPFYISLYLGKGAAWYGFLLSAVSIGSVSGFLLAGVLRLQGPPRAWTIIGGMLAVPILYGTLGYLRIPATALAGAYGVGLAVGLVNVNLMTMAQGTTPPELRGRVMGLVTTLSGGLVPIGMALGGIVGDLTGKNVPLIYSVCGALTVIVILATCLRADTREYLAWGRRGRPGTEAAA
ncbi:MAG TPA: MFS transporter [Thermoanaerobaculia bacterium]|nr:MFS transporter [Thermoanaerobaculia bacterium]